MAACLNVSYKTFVAKQLVVRLTTPMKENYHIQVNLIPFDNANIHISLTKCLIVCGAAPVSAFDMLMMTCYSHLESHLVIY